LWLTLALPALGGTLPAQDGERLPPPIPAASSYVHRCNHIRAASAYVILEMLFGGNVHQDLILSLDPATNTVLWHGSDKRLRQVKAVLLNIDVAVPGLPAPAKGKAEIDPPPVKKILKHYPLPGNPDYVSKAVSDAMHGSGVRIVPFGNGILV